MAGLKQMDLRAWLDRAQSMGELQTVDEANWDQEIGAISHLNLRVPNHKALLFDKVPGCPPGNRMLTCSMSQAPRLGLTLRLGEDLDHNRLLSVLDGKSGVWEQEAASGKYPVQWVPDGPICENVLGPKDYNFNKFPVPFWHQHDGGRYIGTGCAVITAHPETGVSNAGAYRMMLVDEKTVLVHMLGNRHGLLNAQAWWEKEGRCPVVASLGHDPLLYMLAGLEIPLGVSEMEYAGAICGESQKAVKGVTGLPIPAAAELVIEGWIYPDKLHSEGPFGEWHGHYSGLRKSGKKTERLDHILEVERVYHRNNPIIVGAPPGRPPHDFSYFRSVVKSAMTKDFLTRAGVPGVKGVWVYESSGSRCFLVTSIKQQFIGHARQAGFLTCQAPVSMYANKYVVVVDEDINPADFDQVIWALCFRSDPAQDIDIIRKSMGDKGDNTIEDLTRPYNSRAVIDACIPFDRKNDSWMVIEERPELLEAMRARFGHLWK